ncbi:MAG TPA: hypothetical protein VL362_00150 [Patescibacteria group bacterium]|jgi:hypothetical protein|nr:hypothetical protein [Patescibacteria group bacterium]
MVLFSDDDRAARADTQAQRVVPADWAVRFMNARQLIVRRLVEAVRMDTVARFRRGETVTYVAGRYDYEYTVTDQIGNYAIEQDYVDQTIRASGVVSALIDVLEIPADRVKSITVELKVDGRGVIREYSGSNEPLHQGPYTVGVLVTVSFCEPLS